MAMSDKSASHSMCKTDVYTKESISNSKCNDPAADDHIVELISISISQNDLYSKVLMSEPNIYSDFSHLARWLTGNSVALVLSGGGAR